MKTNNSPSRIIFAALCAFLCALTARAQVNVAIGTLAPGESVTITYQVTIDDPLSPAITQISSQGAVTGLSGALGFSVNTDDPETPAADDATITPLQNDPPVIDLNGGTAGNDVTVAFTEGTPQLIAPVGTVTDVDGDDLVSLTATLTARPDGDGVESLSLNVSANSAAAGAGLTLGYTPATGVLLISGTAAASVYQTVLQGILYNNTSENPTTASRSVTVVASDGNPSATQTSTITVAAVNDAPLVTAGNTIGYTEQQAVPPAISPLLTVTDPDSPNLTGATIAITSGFVAGDTLNFSPQNGISGIYDGGTGTLTLSGSSSVANYQTALQSITFSSTSDNPTASGANPARTISFTATDGTDPSTPAATSTINITPLADTPSVTNATTAEDTQTASGLVLSRNAGDGTEVTHFKITAISNGVLFQNDGTTPIVNGDFITFAQGNAGLRFTPAPNFSGTASFDVQASTTADDSGVSGGTATASITVTPLADTPSVTGATTSEDTQTTSGLVISRNALDGVEVTHFKITGISGGTLFQNDGVTPINPGDFITFAEGNAGLKFTPTANLYSPVNTFGITVQASLSASDAGVSGGAATGVVTVDPVADTPSITSATTVEETQTTSGLVISRNAADSTEVTHFKITGISNGTLFQNDGTTPIANGDFITFAEGDAGLKFTPAADLSSPATTFGFDVQASLSAADAGLGGGIATASITVNAVAETPSVTGATTVEDVQTTSGLVISRNAADSTEVTHFKITGISNGTLFQNDGTTPIANGDFITFAQGNAGLKFTPGLNLNSPSTTFGFTVQASTSASDAGLGGGTATASITVTADNDDPVAGTDTLLRAPNDDVKVKVSTLLVNDSDADGGTLTITGVSASTGGVTVTMSDGWVFYPHGTVTVNDSFTYTLSDGQGGTSIGTVNVNIQAQDTQARLLTPTVVGTTANLAFDAIRFRTYAIQSSPDLVSWTTLGNAADDGFGHYTFSDASGLPANNYRVVYLQP